jgi:hypothetical protein
MKPGSEAILVAGYSRQEAFSYRERERVSWLSYLLGYRRPSSSNRAAALAAMDMVTPTGRAISATVSPLQPPTLAEGAEERFAARGLRPQYP